MPIINFFSDLHLEDSPLDYVQPECDVIAVLGDIAPGYQVIDWVEKHLAHLPIPVVIIPGNHEGYYRNWYDMLAVYEKAYREMGVDFLYNKSVLIKDTLFIGGTLFTDFSLFGVPNKRMEKAPTTMTDYLCVDGANGKITPEEVLIEHIKTRTFIEQTLEDNQKRHQTVVMTHHAPSVKSLGIDRSSKYGPYYASNLEPMILKHQPDLWLHGHIHKTVEYFIGETLVMSNPRGRSPLHVNPDFDIDITIKI